MLEKGRLRPQLGKHPGHEEEEAERPADQDAVRAGGEVPVQGTRRGLPRPKPGQWGLLGERGGGGSPEPSDKGEGESRRSRQRQTFDSEGMVGRWELQLGVPPGGGTGGCSQLPPEGPLSPHPLYHLYHLPLVTPQPGAAFCSSEFRQDRKFSEGPQTQFK